MLSKSLRKDGNFNVKNVKKCMMLYYNKKSLYLYCVTFVKNIIDRLFVSVQYSGDNNAFSVLYTN